MLQLINILMSQFQDFEFPRRKNFMKNLNILLNYEPIVSPDKTLTEKLFKKPKQTLTQSINFSSLKNQKETNRPISQGFGSTNGFSRKYPHQLQTRPLISAKQTRRDRMRATLSMENIRKSIKNNRKKVDFLISQNQPKKPDHTTDLRLQMTNAQILYRGEGNSEYQNSFPSVQFQKQYNEEYVQPKQEKKKDFLRKGTSLNKQILTNLMRKKLSREVVDPENYIENQQILRMIKVYKGADLILQKKPESEEKEEVKKQGCQYIEGWQNYTQSIDH